MFEQRENHRVAFDEYRRSLVFRQQFVDGLVEIEAEVRCRIQAAFVQRPREHGRVADVRL